MLTGLPPNVSTSSSICLPLLARIDRCSSSLAASQLLLLLLLVSSLAPLLLLPLLLAPLAHLKDVIADRYLQTPYSGQQREKQHKSQTHLQQTPR
jgi:hypothetical protein